jgi:rubrerythrin
LSTGIELLLKAKLCQEHWTLILSDPEKYRENDWETGQFVSVNIKESLGRLHRLLRSPLPLETQAAVLDLASLRNQYIHFVCRSTPEFVTAVQLKAWHHIIDLLDGRFLKLTYDQSQEIEYAKRKMLEHGEFLEMRFEKLTDEIQFAKDSGFPVIHCPFCNKLSLQIGDNTKCLVCGSDITHAEQYAEAFVANSHVYDDPKDYMGLQEIAYCSACGERACIPVPEELKEQTTNNLLKRIGLTYEPGMDLEAYVCIACNSSFESVDIQECGSCGTLYVSAGNHDVCPECANRWNEV